jgi:hypothetical protein
MKKKLHDVDADELHTIHTVGGQKQVKDAFLTDEIGIPAQVANANTMNTNATLSAGTSKLRGVAADRNKQ